MTQVEKRGLLIAVIICAVFSVSFFTVSVIIKFEQPLPREIKIFLTDDDFPVPEEQVPEESESDSSSGEEIAENTEVVEESAEEVSEQVTEEISEMPPVQEDSVPEVKVPVPEPVVSKADPKPEPVPVPKPAPKKAEPVPAEVKTPAVQKDETKAPEKQEYVPPQIKKSVEELTAEAQAATKKKEVNWDEMFADVEEKTSATEAPKPQSVVKSSVSGTAGTTSSDSTPKSVSTAEAPQKPNQASSSTNAALNAVKASNRNFATSVTDNAKSRTSMQVADVDGKINVKFSNGTLRALVSPRSPVIYLSEENAKKVPVSATVKITFTVLANGRVPVTGISFSPASLLNTDVVNEIKSQISTWTFSSGSESTTATFDYTIEVR